MGRTIKQRLRRQRRRMGRVLSTKPVGHFADVSSYQSGIDWNMYADHHELIVLKVTEGRTFEDPSFPAKFRAARKQADDEGLIVGYYHFARPDNGNDPRIEARHFVGEVRKAGGRLKGRHRLPFRRFEVAVIDYEVTYKGDDRRWVAAFLDEFEKLTDIKPVDLGKDRPKVKGLWLYGYGGSLAPVGSELGMPVWIAAYAPSFDPYWPKGFNRNRLIAWQHTNGSDGPRPHRLAGFPRNHDVSRFFGSRRDLVKLAI